MPTFPKYESYKDSGVEWLGDIPSHWNVSRLKHSIKSAANGIWGSDVNEDDESDGIVCIRVADFSRQNLRVSLEKLTRRKVSDSEFQSRQLIPGDLLLEKSGGGDKQLVGQVVLFGHDIPAVCSNFLARLRVADNFDSSFLNYVHASLYSLRINYKHIKQTTGIQNLDGNSYLSELFAHPDLAEQKRIVEFLDRTTTECDRAISQKQRLIELLQEQKAILINQAVTKGLNPNVPMRDSGIEWIGEIPKHWELKRAKHLFKRIIDTEHKTAPSFENGEYLIVRTSNVKNGELRFEDALYTDRKHYLDWTRRATPEAGDILFTREAPAGEACILPSGVTALIGQRMVLMKVNPDILDADFAVFSIYGGAAKQYITDLSVGSTVAHFNMSDIKNIPFLIPGLSEQHQISQYLKTITTDFNDAVSKENQGIALLHEFKSSLIANSVTGKIKV